MSKPRLFISFSGGRTSAYMTWRLLQEQADRYDIRVLFANTGQEHEKTLEFVDRCDREFGFGVIWIEADVQDGKGNGTRHRVVDFASASRAGSPFEAVIAKYGIPNKNFPHCTRELKLKPMTSYLRAIGWEAGSYTTAIGIRADEMDRVNPKYREQRLWYPLLGLGITKADILGWWAQQPFDLEIREHHGNCTWCWKKSLRKHLTLIHESPEIFDFPRRMERDYAMAGPRGEPQVFFRGGLSTDDLFRKAQEPFVPFMEGDDQRQMSMLLDMDLANGCSESCEAFGEDYDEEAA